MSSMTDDYHSVYTKPGQVNISAFDIDDQVFIWIGNRKVWGNGPNPVSQAFSMKSGDSVLVRFEVYNHTGGRFHAEMSINSSSGTLWGHTADGMGMPGQNIAYSKQVNIMCP